MLRLDSQQVAIELGDLLPPNQFTPNNCNGIDMDEQKKFGWTNFFALTSSGIPQLSLFAIFLILHNAPTLLSEIPPPNHLWRCSRLSLHRSLEGQTFTSLSTIVSHLSWNPSLYFLGFAL
jgi:hypothetical protein